MSKHPLDDPLDDEFDRQTFYRGQDPEADDQEDYELLPPDEEVIAGERRRADEAVEHASKAVDIDALYRDYDSIGAGDVEEYLKDFRFQFGTKHLLMAMTAVAVLFAVGRFVFGGFAPLLLVLTFTVLASIYGWFTWQENKRREEWERKRDELYRRNRQRHDENIEARMDAPDENWPSVTRQDSSLAAWDHAIQAPSVRLAFSVHDLLVLATLLCMALTATVLLGPAGAALGFGVLLGLCIASCVHLANPPRTLTSGAWILMALYITLSLITLVAG